MSERMTAAQLRELQNSKTGTKRVQGAKRVIVDGISFDSKLEGRRWQILKQLEKHGAISNLERQVKFPLHGKNGPIKTPTGRVMHYVADFRYHDRQLNAWVVEDAKGHPTDVYKLKKAILAAQNVSIHEVKQA